MQSHPSSSHSLPCDVALEYLVEELRRNAAMSEETGFNSEHRLRGENLAFDIDVWYPRLARFTFETVFLPLTRHEAAAIVRHYDCCWRQRETSATAEDITLLRNLGVRIDTALARPPLAGSASAFLRLCGRSPKDGEPLDRAAVFACYQRELSQIIEEGEEATGNQKLCAISRTPTLKVDNGDEVLSLLLSSERVYSDMIDWLKHGEPEQIVLRRWEPELKLEYEFRAFVCEGVLCAISQYDHYCVYPQLQGLKDRIEAAIRTLWREMHEDVGVSSYCADFAYLPESDSAILVELSPHLPCTGPAMFSWIADRAVLHGEVGFEFRLNEHYRPQLADLCEVWEDRYRPHERQSIDFPRFDSQWPSEEELVQAQALAEEEKGGWKAEVAAAITSVFSSSPSNDNYGDETELLFVYGTLKTGFHWHDKFMRECGTLLAATATSASPMPLVVGDSGVPYLLFLALEGGEGEAKASEETMKFIRGELWSVSRLALDGMDDYEGVDKGHYQRRQLDVVGDLGRGEEEPRRAWVYMRVTPVNHPLFEGPFIDEYTLEMQNSLYRPIEHILVKQQAYLGQAASTWGLADAAPVYNDAST